MIYSTLSRNIKRYSSYRLLLVLLFTLLISADAFSQLSAGFTNRKDACDGSDNGSIDITITGSTGTINMQVFGPPNFLGLSPTDGVPLSLTGLKSRVAPNEYVVVVQDDLGTKVFSFEIFDISPDLDATLNASSDNFDCTTPDGSIDINVSGGTGSYSFAWTGPNGFTATTEDVSGLEGGDYFVDVFDDGTNCSRSLGPITLANPSIAVQNITTLSPLVLCPVDDAIIALDGSELNKTYEIYVNGVGSTFSNNGTGAAINITLPSGNFVDGDVLTVVGSQGVCADVLMNGSVTVTVNVESVAPTGATVDNPTYCDDAIPANVTLTAVGGTLGTGASVEWYDDAGFTSSVGSGSPLVLAAPAVTTTYFVRYEGTCNNTTGQSVTVTVDNASVAPTGATVDNPTYCDDAAPANITLTAVGGSLGTGATIQWYDDAGFTSNVGNGSPLVLASPTATTTYFVRYEGVCGNTAGQSVTVTVDNASVAPTGATVDNPTYCDDAIPANITLTAVGGTVGTGALVQWYDDAGFTNNVGSGSPLVLASPAVTTTYFVRYEGSCNTTTGQSVTVTVDNASVAPTGATVNTPTYCDDAIPANITLTAVGGTLGTSASVEWYDDAGFTNNVGSGNPLVLTSPTTTTTYFVRYEGTCNITTGQSVTVTVENASVAPTGATVDNPTYCDDAIPANITLTAVGGTVGTGALVRWYDDAGFTNNVGSGSPLVLASPAVTTTYFVRYEGSCNITTGQSVTVTVDNASVAPTGATVNTPTYCDDAIPANITLTAVGGTLGTSALVEWYDDAGFTNNVGSGNPLVLTSPTTTTTYFVRYEGTCNITTGQSVIVTVESASVAPTGATVDNPTYCDDAIPANITLTAVGGTVGTGATIEWYDDAGFTNNVGSGSPLVLASPAVTTTYFVRYEGSCNTTTGQSVTVTVDNASVAPTGATVDNSTYCDDAIPANITLTAVGGTLGTGASVEWYDDAGFTNNVGTGNPLVLTSPTVTTTYFVRYEGTCGNTTDQSVTVTVESASVAPTGATVDNPTYCDDAIPANITLTAVGGTVGTGASVEWYDDAGFTSSVGAGSPLVLASPAVTTTYFVRYEGSCNTTTGQSVTVTVDNASVAPTGATVDNPTYCDDAIPANITLTAVGGTLGTGATIQWYDDAAFTNNVGNGNPLVLTSPTVTTTYFVRYEGTCGNTTDQSVTVTVESVSVAPTGATVDNPTYCDDAIPANITLTAVGGTVGTGATIEWYDDAGFTSNVGSGSPLVLASPAVTTTYFVRYEGSCNITTGQSVTVTVDNASVAPTGATVDSPTYCDDAIPADITLTAVGGALGTGATIQWYDDAAFTNNVGNGSPLVLTSPTATTTYFVRYEGVCGNTTDQSVTVTVETTSVAPTGATVDNANYCDDAIPANITLTAVGGTVGSGAIIEWYDDAGFTSSVGSGSPLVLASPAVTTTYFVRYEGLCNTTTGQSVTVTVDAAPNTGLAVNAASIQVCEGTGTTIDVDLSENGYSYQLRNDANNNAIGTPVLGTGGTINLPTSNLTTTTTFNVLVTNGSCSNVLGTTPTVTVNPLPDVTISGSNAVCENATGEVYSVPDAGVGATYTWTVNNEVSFTGGGINDNTITINWGSLSGDVQVDVVGANLCPASSAVFNVAVGTTSPPPNGGANITQQVCLNDALPSLDANTSGGATVTWYSDAGLTTSIGTGNPFIPSSTDLDMSVVQPNTFFVTQNVGCGESTAIEFVVNVNDLPDATVSGNASVCANTSGEVYSVPFDGTFTYAWTLTGGDGTIVSGASTETVTVDWLTTGGDLEVTVTAPTGCQSVTTVPVAINSAPADQTINEGDQSICENATFSISLASSENGVTYELVLDGTPTGVSNVGDGSNNFVVGVLGVGEGLTTAGSPHNITVEASIGGGCSTTLTGNVQITVTTSPSDQSINEATTSVQTICEAAGQQVTLANSENGIEYEILLDGASIAPTPIKKVGDGNANFVIGTLTASNGLVAGSAYTITVTATSGTCSGTLSDQIDVDVLTVSNPPTDNNGSSPVIACQNGPAPSLSVVGTNVVWYDELKVLTVGTGQTLNTNGLIDTSVAGTTSFFATQDEGCGESNFLEVVVSVENCSGCFTVDVSKTDATCTDDDGTIKLTVGTMGVSPFDYVITDTSDGSTVTQNDQPNNSFTFGGRHSGTYTYLVRDATACEVTGSIDISIKETRVTAEVEKAGDIACFGDPTGGTARITVTDGGVNPYQYKVGSGDWTDFASGDVISGLPAGQEYSILIRDDATDGCPFSSTISISEPAAITGQVQNITDTYPEQDIGSFEVVGITSDFPPFEILLEDDEGNVVIDFTAVGTDLLGNFEFTFEQLQAGAYVAVIQDASGCEFSLPIVNIETKTDIFIPNVFTPNNDGVNEAFIILNKKPNTKIVVANRWGVEVYKSDDYQNDWRAEGLPDGIYFYTMSMDGEVFKGPIEVWRGGAKINN